MPARSTLLARPLGLLIAGAIGVASAPAAEDTTSHQFSGGGHGTLTRDRPIQSGDRFSLRAYLGDAIGTAHVQSGGTFALTASVSSTSGVCYNDTIFRDDFDGDGDRLGAFDR